MKNFKILFSLILLIITCINCSENNNYDNTGNFRETFQRSVTIPNDDLNSCLEQNLPPFINNCIKEFAETVLYLDDYPGCSFSVELLYYFCSPDKLYVGHFWFAKPITCPKYLQEYSEAVVNNKLAEFEFNFNLKIWSAINDQFTNYFATSTNSLAINYVVGSCNYICYEQSEPSPTGQTGLIPVFYNCGENCCKVTRNYVKINGVFVPSTPLEIFAPNVECETNNVNCVEGGTPLYSRGCDELVSF